MQADVLARLATRVVVPMMTRKRFGATPITRLNPVAKIAGAEYVALFQELAAVPTSARGTQAVASLRARRAELIGALDLLVTGHSAYRTSLNAASFPRRDSSCLPIWTRHG